MPPGGKLLFGAAAAAGAYMLGKKHRDGTGNVSNAGAPDSPMSDDQSSMLASLLQSSGISLEQAAARAGVQVGPNGLTRTQALQIIASLGGG